MEKGKLCNDHFVMNCKLCGGESPAIAPSAPIIKTTPIPESPVGAIVNTIEGMQVVRDAPSRIINAAPVRSAEAQNVMTVADEYARACESYSEAQAAVAAMMVHIAKMTEVLTNLQNSVVTTRQEKDEAKRRVFDSMKEGT